MCEALGTLTPLRDPGEGKLSLHDAIFPKGGNTDMAYPRTCILVPRVAPYNCV